MSISLPIRPGVVFAAVFAATGCISFTLVERALARSAASAPDSGQHISVTPAETQYLQRSAAAMDTMMRDMRSVPSGDVDQDFVAQMIPHHQGAIQMAIAILAGSHNVQLRRLAEEIIVTQREEIVAMRLAISEPRLSSAGRP